MSYRQNRVRAEVQWQATFGGFETQECVPQSQAEECSHCNCLSATCGECGPSHIHSSTRQKAEAAQFS